MISPYLTPNDVAALLHISVRRVHELVRLKKLACVQVTPKKRLFTDNQLQDFCENQTVATPRKIVKPTGKTTKNPVDKEIPVVLGSDSKSFEGLSRAQLLKEMRSWR